MLPVAVSICPASVRSHRLFRETCYRIACETSAFPIIPMHMGIPIEKKPMLAMLAFPFPLSFYPL